MPPVKQNANIANIDSMPDSVVLTTAQVCHLTGISRDTLGCDPEMREARVQLSKRRFGYPLGFVRERYRLRQRSSAAA
jgi:hypothetical protein